MIKDEDSILTSIKKLLGIEKEYTQFDIDLIVYINSVFMVLNQLGIGPTLGYSIKDSNNLWTEFLEEGDLLNSAKSYIYLKVKLLFDPPISSASMDSTNKLINEFEWRMNVKTETK